MNLTKINELKNMLYGYDYSLIIKDDIFKLNVKYTKINYQGHSINAIIKLIKGDNLLSKEISDTYSEKDFIIHTNYGMKFFMDENGDKFRTLCKKPELSHNTKIIKEFIKYDTLMNTALLKSAIDITPYLLELKENEFLNKNISTNVLKKIEDTGISLVEGDLGFYISDDNKYRLYELLDKKTKGIIDPVKPDDLNVDRKDEFKIKTNEFTNELINDSIDYLMEKSKNLKETNFSNSINNYFRKTPTFKTNGIFNDFINDIKDCYTKEAIQENLDNITELFKENINNTNKINHQETEEESDEKIIEFQNLINLGYNNEEIEQKLKINLKGNEQHIDTSILKEADDLLNNDRAKDYGKVEDNFKNITDISNILLKDKDIVLDEVDVCNVLIALKIAREGNKHKRDNLVDATAYLNIKQVLIDSKKDKNEF